MKLKHFFLSKIEIQTLFRDTHFHEPPEELSDSSLWSTHVWGVRTPLFSVAPRRSQMSGQAEEDSPAAGAGSEQTAQGLCPQKAYTHRSFLFPCLVV